MSIDPQLQSEQQPMQVQPEADLRIRLLRAMAVFAGIILIVIYAITAVGRTQLEQRQRSADLAFTETVAGQLDDPLAFPDQTAAIIQDWLKILSPQTTAVVLIVDNIGRVLFRHENGYTVPGESVWNAWQHQAIRAVPHNDIPVSWTSTSPDGRDWLHTQAPIGESDLFLILERPAEIAFAPLRTITLLTLLFGGLYIFTGLLSWYFLSRQVIGPLERIEAFSSLIRWRGHVRPDEKIALTALSRRTDQLGTLAQTLIEMEENIQTRFLELSTLLETGRAVAASLDVNVVLNNILDQVQNLFAVDRCAIVTLNGRAGVFRIRVSRGISETYVDQLRIAPSEPNSAAMRALKKQTPVQIPDTETDLAFRSFRPRARAEGYRSVLAIPLTTHHAPPAVLLLYKNQPYRYSFRELELASSFGHHASIAMENAALYARSDERLQEQTQRLEAIVESLDDGLILESTAGQLLFCNERALTLLGLTRGQVHVQTASELVAHLLSKAETRPNRPVLQIMDSAGRETHFIEITQKAPNGTQRDLRLHVFEVLAADGEQLGRGHLWQDITKDKELDRMKSALISTVSHELRTPLAAIKGYATTLLAEDVEWDQGSQREFLQTISHESDRLAELVKDLLDMSLIEAGTLPLRREPASIGDVIRNVVKNLGFSGNGRVEVDIAENVPVFALDVARLETVIRNLVENAAKYSDDDAPIAIAAFCRDDEVQITVRDYGPGIPTHLHNRIFDRFYRIDNGTARRVGGTGLGLAICRGFVEAHGGRISIANGRPGAIFTVSLPLNRAAELAPG